MTTLFGWPMDGIEHVLLAIFGVITAGLVLAAWRYRLFLKLGMRNIPRRRLQSALIVFGLTLATVIVTSAFTAGDTMSYTIRSDGAQAYGAVDETVTQPAAPSTGKDRFANAPNLDLFSGGKAASVSQTLHGNPNIDGITVALALPAPMVDLTTRQSKATSNVLAVPANYPAAFGPLTTERGQQVTLRQLGPNNVYINHQAAYSLNAHRGDTIQFFVQGKTIRARVAGILRDEGLASGGLIAQRANTDPEIVMPLGRLQRQAGLGPRITHVLISNRGDIITGATHTAAVKQSLAASGVMAAYHLDTVKQTALQRADKAGSEFTAAFVGFGLFSMTAGVLLIFLLFVMLAAERRVEMGIERAIGTHRRHLVAQFLFEGYAYDLVAALIGVVVGLIVGLSMVSVMSSLFAGNNAGFSIQGHVEPRSVIVAFCLGAIVTFISVAGACWWISRLNIVAALRDLPDNTEIDHSMRTAFTRPILDLRTAWRRARAGHVRTATVALFAAPWHLVSAFSTLIVRGPLLLVAGYLLFQAGNHSNQAFPYYLGLSLCLVGGAMLLRWLLLNTPLRSSLSNRIGFSLAGISLVAFWSLPFDYFSSNLYLGPEMFFLYGLMMILGGVWTVMYNVDLLVNVGLRLVAVAGRLAPALRMAVTYPMQQRMRTGLTLFMFSLVVFALMVESTIFGSFGATQLQLNRDAGGYAMYGTAAAPSGIPHVQQQVDRVPALHKAGVTAGSAQRLSGDVRQRGNDGNRWSGEVINVVDDDWLASTHFSLNARAQGYTSDAAVWQTLRRHPGYAVASADLASFNQQQGGYGLNGLKYDGGSFRPIHIDMRDPRTGKIIPLTVIGLLNAGAARLEWMYGTYVGANTLQAAGDRPISPDIYYFHVPSGVNVHGTALALGSAFLPYGLDVTEVQVQYSQDEALSTGFQNLVAAFMALGLVVGIAALGVIATRSVVERRQQLGILRAIGFKRGLVQTSFLMEASFISLAGIGIGTVLGLVFGYQFVSYLAETEPGLNYVIPWGEVALVVAGTYLVALAMTYLPSWQASRVHPAEALRYE